MIIQTESKSEKDKVGNRWFYVCKDDALQKIVRLAVYFFSSNFSIISIHCSIFSGTDYGVWVE